MNIAALLGVLAAIGITAYTIMDSAKNPAIFLDVHGIVIVLGGTLTVALLTFNFSSLFKALWIVFRKMFGIGRVRYRAVIEDIVTMADLYRKNPQDCAQIASKKIHPFLKDAIQLIVDFGFSIEEMDDIMTNNLEGKKKRDKDEIHVWHTVSRFPPAFGLLGATVGMIALLQTLGEEGAQDRVGPAMATALVATFYGLITANLFVIPIAEKLQTVSVEDTKLRTLIKEGVLLVMEKKHPSYVEEYLKSFLSPSERKRSYGQSGGANAGKTSKAA